MQVGNNLGDPRCGWGAVQRVLLLDDILQHRNSTAGLVCLPGLQIESSSHRVPANVPFRAAFWTSQRRVHTDLENREAGPVKRRSRMTAYEVHPVPIKWCHQSIGATERCLLRRPVGAPFPLTPALSLGERGSLSAAPGNWAARNRLAASDSASLSLGRGIEGEGDRASKLRKPNELLESQIARQRMHLLRFLRFLL